MHDHRAVRRRRAVLAGLVALSIALLTAYFGESASGGLHAVQRGVMDVLAPIQEGANRALKPVRDLFGWVGDTMDAKSERDELRKERDQLRREVADLQLAQSDLQDLQSWRQSVSALNLGVYEPVSARVYERSPSTWYSTVVINKGASDGVRKDQPVLNGAGLVGRVKSTSSGSAVVTLLTDQDFGVSAVTAKRREPGTVSPAVGGDLDRRIHVRPAADLRRLDVVQVLTEPSADLRADATP